MPNHEATDTSGGENSQQFICGVPSEWKAFQERHRLFLERYHNLADALRTAFIRRAELEAPIDKFVFEYGRLCCEDFHEVLLLCGNGYGIGALKLLRTLYEHAVTLCYLSEHPEELSAFWDYSFVAQHKILAPILEAFGEDSVDRKVADEIERRFADVKEQFLVTDCKECGSKRLNHTWSKLDFVAMAKKTDAIGRLIVLGYLLPLRHAHATAASLESRLEMLDDGTVSFIPTAQRKEADQALVTAHNVILKVLGVQNTKFAVPGLNDKLQVCMQDFLDMYGSHDSNL
jgi:hypothetical protein